VIASSFSRLTATTGIALCFAAALLLAACGGQAPDQPAALATVVPPSMPLATATPAAGGPLQPIAPLPFRPRATPTPVGTATLTAGAPFVLANLQDAMLTLVNQDRAKAGIPPVAWDVVAAQVAQAQAQEMLDNDYLSHWNLAGQGPDQRYAESGGLDAVFENLHASAQRYSDGRGVPVTDWQARLADVEQGLMESAGHSENILDPAHTHVGVGIAFDADTGELRLVQEFVNRYADIDPMPAQVSPGAIVPLKGRLLSLKIEPAFSSVACEPLPTPMTPDELNKTGTYMLPGGVSAGEVARQLKVSDDRVQDTQTIPAATQPAQCYVRVWATIDERQVLVVDRLVGVQ
jgi:uncharacterized protein YkwD